MSLLFVKAYHGPSSTFSGKKHKPEFLYGLRDCLQKLGFRISLIPVSFDDYCMLEMCGHEVFRSKMHHFKFNTDHSRDGVCERAVNAVVEAAVKFRRARACLWFWTALDHQLFRRSKYAPRDFWAVHVDFTSENYDNVCKCKECTTCCDIPAKRPDDIDLSTNKSIC